MGLERTVKDHEIAQMVSELTEVAKQYAETQQLRSRIRSIVLAYMPSPNPIYTKHEHRKRQSDDTVYDHIDAENATDRN